MTIKGTLETFNLPDLLQMLAFNQKAGTLVLETAAGARTVCVERGLFGFVQGDLLPSRTAARILRRTSAVASDRLARAEAITANSGRYLGDALTDLGVIDAAQRTAVTHQAISELAFDLVQTSITRFEFVEGRRLAPSGTEAEAIEPLMPVDGFLIDLTRKLDEWSLLRQEIPTEEEVFERTDLSPDLRELDVPEEVVTRVLPLLDGSRTVAAVVEESDHDRFSVVKTVAHLVRQGVLRATGTSSLTARAEELARRGRPADALPLLRLAVARGDADPSVRARLADALTAAGDRVGAAAELDAYAGSVETADPVAAFDALHRAQDLRGDDVASACKTCDCYLRNAPRLRKRLDDALRALKALVGAATAAQRPAEAATRLAQFVERGEAPAEDLLVLADLWAAAGRRPDAAQALVRRAEILLHQGRVPQAREVLRRAVTLDPTRVDARRRLGDLDNAESRRRHRRRLVVLGALLGLTAASAGAVYLVHDGRASHAAEASLGRVEGAAREAESTGNEALAAFQRVVDATAEGTAVDGALEGAVTTLQRVCETAARGVRAAITSAEEELREVTGPRASAALDRLRDLDARRAAIVARAQIAVRGVGERATQTLDQGEKAYAEGRFRDAKALLQQSARLSFDDPGRASRARKNLDAVEGYVAGFTRARAAFDAALEADRTDEAWRLGCRMLATYLDSDLTRELLLPVPVTTEPRAARVRVGATGAPTAAPTTVRYSPFGELALTARAPGCVPQTAQLPSYAKIREAEAAGGQEPVRLAFTLVEGARWTSHQKVSAGPFDLGETAWVASEDGLAVHTLRPTDGSPMEVRALPAITDRIRALGRSPTGGLWLLVGLRSFLLVPEGGTPWQYQTSGRLERGPAVADSTMLLADDTGILAGLDPTKGTPRWRGTLDAAPAQSPVATPLGFVLTTASGDVVVVNPKDGKTTVLVPGAARRAALALWWGDSVLVVGGRDGLAEIAPNGRVVKTMGDADPDPAFGLVSEKDAVAWVERSGLVRALVRGAAAPLDVGGVSVAAVTPALADGAVYSVGRDRVLRVARLDAPGSTAWKVKLPGTALGSPVIAGDLVIVRTDAGTVAFER
ncbi:MAG: DUF4388 domain-containing protein [Planctomycetota bacterium]